MKFKTKNRVRTFLSTPVTESKITALTGELGITSVGDVIRRSIDELYNAHFPTYKRQKPSKITEDDIREKICQYDLEGEVIESNGKKLCVYHTHDRVKDYEQTVPIELVSSDLVDGQYIPNKEAVLNYRAQKSQPKG